VPLPKLTLSKFRKAAKALREVALTKPAQQVVCWLEGMRQEPPERANAFHYHCAAESYYLLGLFSKKPPTLYDDGPFVTLPCCSVPPPEALPPLRLCDIVAP
jgi:hypothetical protein